jgi:hypothetical protein
MIYHHSSCIKVHIFWESHKNMTKSPNFFWQNYISNIKNFADFVTFVWLSQNIWTLGSSQKLYLGKRFLLLNVCFYNGFWNHRFEIGEASNFPVNKWSSSRIMSMTPFSNIQWTTRGFSFWRDFWFRVIQ